MDPSAEEESVEFGELSIEDSIFQSLSTEEKAALLKLAISQDSKKSSDDKPASITSIHLMVGPQVLIIQTNYDDETMTEEVLLAGEPNGLDKKPPTFWQKVTEVSIGQDEDFGADAEVDLIFRHSTNLTTFVAAEPLPSLVDKFQSLFDKNSKTLTIIMILEDGKGTRNTDFDFNHISNCSALEGIIVLTNGNVKNFRKIPLGISLIVSTHTASDEEIEWISENLKDLKSLMIWGEVRGTSNKLTEAVLTNFLKAPKFKTLVLLMSGEDPEVLLDSLLNLKDLCDALGEDSGVKAGLDTQSELETLAPNKKVDFVFSCQIDRNKFQGI